MGRCVLIIRCPYSLVQVEEGRDRRGRSGTSKSTSPGTLNDGGTGMG